MAALSLLFNKAQWHVKYALGLVAPVQNSSGNLVWEGSVKEQSSCCQVVWVLKD